jgi:hypothetical protein
MKFKGNLLILSAILIAVLILVTGCFPTPTAPPPEEDVPNNGSISIAHGAAATNDATPTLTISATGADYMAFSGDKATWNAWVAYAAAYSTFNITSGAGCSAGEGTKTVYVKFKNDAGESITYNDTIEYDITKPKLSTALYSDAKNKGSGTVNKGDTIDFTFNDEMDKSTITSSNVTSRLPLSAGNYGTGPTVSWNTAGTVCTVILGTSPTIVSGTTVNPSSSVTDIAGNADNSSAVTITGLTSTTVLFSVSISPSADSTTAGGATVNLTAKALDTASGDITTSCTFTWSILSIGTISPTTGSSTVYTPPLAGTGTDTIKVTAVKTGTTTPVKTAYAYITVRTTTPPPPLVDPAKLFVSAQNQNAKYTSLPVGAKVEVYSDATNNAATAVGNGVKVTINSDNTWTVWSGAIGNNDYIFFTMTDSSMWTSPITADGQIPTEPYGPGGGLALDSIQATSKNMVTSSAAGNVAGNDKITLYVGGTAYSAATSVGSPMTLTTDLIAGNEPKYTRTNPDGHESVISAADGEILILTTAADDNAGGTAGTLETGDRLILSFGGVTKPFNVNAPITVSNISWVATGIATLGTGVLTGTGTTLVSVPLTATATCTDFATGETVNFNILPNTPIVDTTGGNQVLPAATPFAFDDTNF